MDGSEALIRISERSIDWKLGYVVSLLWLVVLLIYLRYTCDSSVDGASIYRSVPYVAPPIEVCVGVRIAL